MSGKLTKVLGATTAIAMMVFLAGLTLLIAIMGLAYVMPSWWQFVFLAVAIPTISAVPVWLIAGCALIALATRGTP